eukprot:2253462-Amphidinium_carterae.1
MYTPKPAEGKKSFYVQESPAGATGVAYQKRRITRVHIVNGDRPIRAIPPGPEDNDPQVNICLADDFIDLMEMLENEEEAIRAFRDLPSDD